MRLAGAVLKVSLKVHSLWSGSRQPFVPLTPLETVEGTPLETVEGWGPGEYLHEQVLPPALVQRGAVNSGRNSEIEHHGPDSSSSSGPSYLRFCYFDLIALSTHVNDGTGCKQRGMKHQQKQF